MKITVEIKDEDVALIREQLNMDMEKGAKKFVESAVKGLVQVALLKKSGVKIDIKKIMEAGVELGKEATREARKHEDAENRP